jgi:hypothetical protein
MKLNSIFGGDTLKAADLQGREFTLVIETVKLKDFDDGPKLIITFRNAKKSLIANKTNSETIALMHGDDTDFWIGKEIVIGTDLVNFQGKMVEAIRVRRVIRRAEPTPPRQVTAEAGQIVQERTGYTLSTGTDKHPNAPGNDFHSDDIPF